MGAVEGFDGRLLPAAGGFHQAALTAQVAVRYRDTEQEVGRGQPRHNSRGGAIGRGGSATGENAPGRSGPACRENTIGSGDSTGIWLNVRLWLPRARV